MYIATLYYNRELYVAEVPQTLYSETVPLIQTRSRLVIKRATACEELETIMNERVYVVLHAVSPSKKAKRPADGISWTELSFQPCAYYAQLDVDEIFQSTQQTQQTLTITKQLKLAMTSTAQTAAQPLTLTCQLKCNAPNPTALGLSQAQIGVEAVNVWGSLSNVQRTFGAMPPFGYTASVKLPWGEERVVARNGYFRSAQTAQSEMRSAKDLLKTSAQDFVSLVFPEQSAHVPQTEIETGFKDLYNKLFDSKVADKQRLTDSQAFTTKLLAFKQQSLKLGQQVDPTKKGTQVETAVTFNTAINALKQCVNQSFNEAIIEYVNQQNKAIVDPKKKAAVATEIVFVLEGDVAKFPLYIEQSRSNKINLLLSIKQTNKLREDTLLQTPEFTLTIKLDELWEQLGIKLEDFISTCVGSLAQLKSKPTAIVKDLTLLMTEQQQKKLVDLGATEKGDKKDKKQQQADQINPLVTNFATADILFDLSKTGLVPSEQAIIESVRRIAPNVKELSQRIKNEQLYLRSYKIQQTDFNKALTEAAYLPPSLRPLSDQEKTLFSFKIALQKICSNNPKIQKDEFQKLAKPAIQACKADLMKAGYDLTDSHAQILKATGEVIRSPPVAASPEDLCQYADGFMLQTNNENAVRTMKLYGQSLTRERARLPANEKTEQLERAALGLLICASLLGDKKTLERQLLKILQLSFISPLCYKDLSLLAASELTAIGEYALALSLLQLKELNSPQSFLEWTLTAFILQKMDLKMDAAELQLLLERKLRDKNSEMNLFSGVTEQTTQTEITTRLFLALGEHLSLRRCIGLVQSLTDEVAQLMLTFDSNKRSLATKTALVASRSLLLRGKHADARTLVSKFGGKKNLEVAKLLNFLRSPDELHAGYPDLVDDKIEPIPGSLQAIAYSCVNSHKVPSLLLPKGSKLQQTIVCAAINGLLPQKHSLSILSDSVVKQSASQPEIPGYIIAPETHKLLTELTTSSVLFNSKTALDILLVASGMARQQVPVAYQGILDVKNLAGFGQDDFGDQVFLKLYYRWSNCFAFLKIPVPFSQPLEGELGVARRIHEQVAQNMKENPIPKQHFSLTTDYLGKVMSFTDEEILKLALQKAQNLLLKGESPEITSSLGLAALYLQNLPLALNCFQRALQLDGTEEQAWLGIALVLSVQLKQKPEEERDKMRQKVVECVGRVTSSYQHLFIAVSHALLDPTVEKATIYAMATTKLLKQLITMPPLTALVPFMQTKYDVDFGSASYLSNYHIKRLLAVSYESCGRAEDVATALTEALDSFGGIKPGTSLEEISQRILLVTECAAAWGGCGRQDKAEEVMANGLSE